MNVNRWIGSALALGGMAVVLFGLQSPFSAGLILLGLIGIHRFQSPTARLVSVLGIGIAALGCLSATAVTMMVLGKTVWGSLGWFLLQNELLTAGVPLIVGYVLVGTSMMMSAKNFPEFAGLFLIASVLLVVLGGWMGNLLLCACLIWMGTLLAAKPIQQPAVAERDPS